MTFPARFRGRCAACDLWWMPGDPIRPYGTHPDGSTLYAHADCDHTPDHEEPAREICRTCWLEKSISGACGCEED